MRIDIVRSLPRQVTRSMVTTVATLAWAFSAGAGQTTVWFAPESHYPPANGSDFADAFNHPESWAEAVKRINVLLISTQTFSAAPVSFVKTLVDFTTKNRIKLGITAEFQCFGKLSGTPEFAASAVDKIKKAGGNIDYIAMDEPLYHIHYNSAPTACHLPIDETVKRTGGVVNVLTAAFPNAIVGDIEPFPILSNQPDWKQAFSTWLVDVEQLTNHKIAFLHLDFDWRSAPLTKGAPDIPDANGIKNLVQEVAAFATTKDIPLGMIIDGRAVAQSDAEWVAQAQTNLNFVAAAGVPLTHLMYSSWHKYPQKIMPDSDPTTFSGFVLRSSGAR